MWGPQGLDQGGECSDMKVQSWGGVTVTKGMGQGGLGVTRRLSTGQPWAGEDLRGQASLGKAGAGGGRLLQGLEQEGRADTI